MFDLVIYVLSIFGRSLFYLSSCLRPTDSQLFSFSSSSCPWTLGHFLLLSLYPAIPVYLSKHFGLAYLFGSSLLVPFSKAVVPSIAHRPTGISHIFVHNVYISTFESPFPHSSSQFTKERLLLVICFSFRLLMTTDTYLGITAL